jgi:hypothetical protein
VADPIRAALSAQPPALDLNALLSPEGPYERASHGGDGAQLVSGPHGGNPQWWDPLYGCDTLDNLLDQIRSRILPHLRPPIAGIDVPGPDGDYGGLQELCEAEGVDPRIGAPLLKRAREAWKVAAQPPAVATGSNGERTDPIRDALRRAEMSISGGLCYFKAEAKHAQLRDAQRDLEDLRAALEGQPPAPAAVPADLTPTRYLYTSGATIERTRTDPDAWAVRRGSERMSVLGEWSIEPSPSERGADYLAEHSFASPHAALEVLQYQQPPQGGEVQP